MRLEEFSSTLKICFNFKMYSNNFHCCIFVGELNKFSTLSIVCSELNARNDFQDKLKWNVDILCGAKNRSEKFLWSSQQFFRNVRRFSIYPDGAKKWISWNSSLLCKSLCLPFLLFDINTCLPCMQFHDCCLVCDETWEVESREKMIL